MRLRENFQMHAQNTRAHTHTHTHRTTFRRQWEKVTVGPQHQHEILMDGGGNIYFGFFGLFSGFF